MPHGLMWARMGAARRALSLAILLSLLPVYAGSSPRVAAAPEGAPGPRLVLAFYYMWYGPDSFNSGQMPDRPATPYISDHTDVIERQVREAKGAGIDAFVSSWTGTGTETDQNFPKLLDVAAKQGFKATIYFETNFAAQRGDVYAQLKSALDRFSGHPAFLRWNGKPVVFFWSPGALGNAAAWSALRQRIDPEHTQIWSVDTTDRSYLDVFDGVHFFSAGKWSGSTDVARVNSQWRGIVDAYNRAKGTSRVWAAGVIPGWDESRVQPLRANAKVFPRRDGAMYSEGWTGAIASNPEWVTITSWNEWFEGTQIEPSATYGNMYLDLTRRYSGLWKNGPDPCDGGTYYKETGHALCKQMEAYWQQYGGLAQFGFPISDARSEPSAVDGKTYTVQYFERARFELHPENPAPYNVLLGLLGRQAHRPDPPAPAISDGKHTYFKESGHNVGVLFAQYWQAHGGLFVNGYPISEEFQEKGTDGKMYTVQYFERVRFELHPENPAPYKVLLGALGRQAFAAAAGR